MITAISERLLMIDFKVRVGPGLALPGRSLIARENGRVIIFSPGPFSDEDWRRIYDFGTVVAVVAPNLWHHKWAAATLARFPEARFFRPEGLGEKVPALKDRGEPFAKIGFLNFKDLEHVEIGGMPKVRECVFYFPKDRLLYVNDLVFHILKPASFLAGLILTVAGTKGRLAPSRAMRFLIQDPTTFRRDLTKVFEWNFDKVVMAHGEPLWQEGKFLLQKSLELAP